MNLYLYEAHSYYNRKIVRYRYTYEYEESFGGSSYVANNISFNPNDGITTTQIINYPLDHPYFEGTAAPSYCLVVDDAGNIVSRWWITSHSRIRKGQANLSLLRDVIADYYDEVMTAPSFVRKGYISTINDTAIYNNEEMTFNQIKTSEYKLKDKSNAAWYVGYISKTAGGETISIPTDDYVISGDYETLEQYPYYANTNANTPFVGDYTDITFRINFYNNMAQGWDENGNPKLPTYDRRAILYTTYGAIATTNQKGFPVFTEGKHVLSDIYPWVSQAAKSSITNWRESSYAITGAHRGSALTTFLEQEGKYIRIAGTTYKISIENVYVSRKVDIDNTNIFAQSFKDVAIAANNIGGVNMIRVNAAEGNWSAVEYTAQGYKIVLEAQPENDIEYTLPTTRNHCADSPYDLVMVPATFLWLDDNEVSIDVDLSKKVIDALILKLGANGYDWQLLPYSPLEDRYFEAFTGNSGSRLRTSLLPNMDYYDIIGEGQAQTIILFPSISSFNKTIKYIIDVPADSTNFKVANECDIYRLCSPNYNGQFEFSATKNGGVLAWNVSCSYKPFAPYIRVAPAFNKLYGRNFFDARGLICGGDFSLTQTDNNWVSYQIQNKNYQVMFDRQIENMEVNNSVQRTLEGWNVATGTISGAASGAMAGGMTGNPYAAIGGAIVGGVTSFAGGLADIHLNEKLRQEAMDYSKDQFGYQLQNIRALPNSITKVGAATNDFKYWPFVEYYTCTDIEKQALLDKMKWNGMTIMRVGQVQDFLHPYLTEAGTFIQAKPIRLDYIAEDSHLAEAIAAELNTGVYII